jgi:hypothetical protein
MNASTFSPGVTLSGKPPTICYQRADVVTHESRKGRMFFLKKNQKTFANSARILVQLATPDSYPYEKKFFGSFFQKKNCFLCRRSRVTSNGRWYKLVAPRVWPGPGHMPDRG